MMKTPICVRLVCLCSLLLMVAVMPARAKVKVHALIGDGMVLQQKTLARITGSARPDEKIAVTIAGQTARTVADAHGGWSVKLKPMDAGGPHTLTIKGDDSLVFRDVLVGEVWVCSGQSNMEWMLAQAANGEREVAAANHPRLRLFTIKKRLSPIPLDDVTGTWAASTPESAARFSAVAYFFGRELQQKLGVPVGLIHSSWGGTPVEGWTSREALAARPSAKELVANFDRVMRESATNESSEAYEFVYKDTGNLGFDLGYARTDFDARDWKKMSLPQLWENAGLQLDGAFWFRREIEIPNEWAGRDLALHLAALDDFDTTYFDGVQVGATGIEREDAYAIPRRYTIPASLVKAGRHVIAVRLFDRVGGGGFAAGAGEMKVFPADGLSQMPITLDGEWLYFAERALPPHPVASLGRNNPNTPTLLYNAMIAPLTAYTLRGAIWYQGENNVSRAHQYRDLFPTMIRDWRARWGQGDFPFYFVQLANFLPVNPEPGESDWAELREAQTLTLREPNTGMAVAIDIGEAGDIHPRNKQDVGHRLAVNALAQTYKQKIEYSGPRHTEMKIVGDEVVLSFAHTTGGLTTKNNEPPKGFAVAGDDHKFVWATARIEGDKVIVRSERVPRPRAVRYAWANNPVCNLYNGAGLPASPFRTDEWRGVTQPK